MGGALDPTVARARAAVRDALVDLPLDALVVVAVSGGADSLALAAATAFVAGRDGRRAEAVIVDHGLQPDSAVVAHRAAGQCVDLGLAAEIVRAEVTGRGGPEAAARRARYTAFERHIEVVGPATVLLAHTLDDQAETVLLGLGRGSGPRSIAGMAPVAGRYRRPFLGLRRADTERICAAHGLTPWRDPHNDDPAYRRVRVRREALPVLEDVLGGGVAEALARTATRLASDVELLDSLAADWLASHPELPVSGLAALHDAIRSRVLHAAALAAGAAAGEVSAGHVHEIDRLVTDYRGQRRIELPGGVACHRTGDRLSFAPTPVAG